MALDGNIDLIKLNELVAELDDDTHDCLTGQSGSSSAYHPGSSRDKPPGRKLGCMGAHGARRATAQRQSQPPLPTEAEQADKAQLDSVSAAMQELKEEAAAARGGRPHVAEQRPNERAAADFLHIAREAGLRGLCDALGFCGLRNELPQLCSTGVTVLAPTDAAFAQLASETRCNAALVRQLLLAHLCSGISMLTDLQAKRTALALAGQTHAVNLEGGHTYVGTSRVSRSDLAFEGGVIHEVDSVLVVLHLIRDAHSEQVWKKTLQPAPCLSIVGGTAAGTEYEVHGCLLHAATGQLVPDALRGHTRAISPLPDEQSISFSEITVMAKPPSLAKRRGVQSDGTNRYRLLFSLWNSSTLSYVTWQHMSTPLVVRNSFHMLPVEEKNYRRQQYARTRSRGGAGCPEMDEVMMGVDFARMPSLPESELLRGAPSITSFTDTSRWLPLSQASGLDPSFTHVRRSATFDTEGSSEYDELSSVGGQVAGSAGGADSESLSVRMLPEKEMEMMQNLAQRTSQQVSPRENGVKREMPEPSSSVASCEASSSRLPEEVHRSASEGGSSVHRRGFDGLRLLDCSVHSGSCSGGTVVWLQGENFTSDVAVFFGGVPAAAIEAISAQLIKCTAPEAQAYRRHQVAIQVLNPTDGSRSAERLAFTYVPDNERHLESKWQPELLERLLASLERAHQQVGATAAAGDTLSAEALLRCLDEHGKSLFEYTRALRRMLSFTQGYAGSSYREETAEEASELQLGMADLAREQLGEQLAKSLAHRPDVEVLQQRNILHPPESDADKVAKRKRLEEGLLHRPKQAELQERNILKPQDPAPSSPPEST